MIEIEMILKILNEANKPLLSKEISKHIYHKFDGFEIDKKTINEILWNDLKDEVFFNRKDFTFYSKNKAQEKNKKKIDPLDSTILNDILKILLHIQNINDVTVQNINVLMIEFLNRRYVIQDIRRVYNKNDIKIFEEFHIGKDNFELKEFEQNNRTEQTKEISKNDNLIDNKNLIAQNLEREENKNKPTFNKILENFISIHKTNFRILETENDKLNELIKLVVIDNRITGIEKRFLIEKTKELQLSTEIIDLAEKYLGSNNPILDKMFEIIFQDGKIDNIEIEFIQEKSIELGLNQDMVNERFWSYAIHFHLKDLINLVSFKNWLLHWYIDEYSSHKEINEIKLIHKFLDIFSGKNFNEIIELNSFKLKQENLIVNSLKVSDQINYPLRNDRNLQLTHLSKLHLDALCWFSLNKNKSFNYKEISGEKQLENGPIYLFNTAKGIHKPKTEKYALSIKVLKDNSYQDRIENNSDGTWSLKYHKEDGSEWTNDGLIKCMEDKVPIGLFYQTKSPPSPIYIVHGLGLINEYDGIYFKIREIDKLEYDYFNWSPELVEIIESKPLLNQELEILKLYELEPFIAMQRFKEYYKNKNDRRISNLDLTEAFNLFIETNQ